LAGGRRGGESSAKSSGALRRRRIEREPAREQAARESGYGFSGRESSGGQFQGRERHERRPRSVGVPRRTNGGLRKGLVRAASTARTVERGKNPEDGTGRRFGDLRSVGAARAVTVKKGHPASRRSWEQEPRRGRPPIGRTVSTRSRGAGRGRTGGGGHEAAQAPKESRTPREERRGLGSAARPTRKTPRPVERRRGGSAGSQQGATRRVGETFEGDDNSGEPVGARVTAWRSPPRSPEPLDGQT
jgi:hypothetical protein